jgi:DNA segregation ATPase FtsK/SpoIIIE-like protein
LSRPFLCDFKKVELDAYNGLPHLLTPVITDAKKTTRAFNWLNKEIDGRYELLKNANVKFITDYHSKRERKSGSDEYSEFEQMPFILAVVDEFSDAMLTYPREIEAVVARAAQLGAQVGVHIVIATSNPGSKVLTSSIKSNIPARVTFQVTSETDSRSVLGSVGAENLRGIGNALFIARDITKPISLQSFHMTDNDIRETVDLAVKSYSMAPSTEEIDLISRTHRDTDSVFLRWCRPEGRQSLDRVRAPTPDSVNAKSEWTERPQPRCARPAEYRRPDFTSGSFRQSLPPREHNERPASGLSDSRAVR